MLNCITILKDYVISLWCLLQGFEFMFFIPIISVHFVTTCGSKTVKTYNDDTDDAGIDGEMIMKMMMMTEKKKRR